MSQPSAMLAPAPAAIPLTAATTRKRQCAQPAHERIVIGVERASEHDGFAVLIHPLVQILPGAERATGASEQERAAVTVVLRLGERALEMLMHGLGECVEVLRPVERDDAIPFAPLDKDRCCFHARLLASLNDSLVRV